MAFRCLRVPLGKNRANLSSFAALSCGAHLSLCGVLKRFFCSKISCLIPTIGIRNPKSRAKTKRGAGPPGELKGAPPHGLPTIWPARSPVPSWSRAAPLFDILILIPINTPQLPGESDADGGDCRVLPARRGPEAAAHADPRHPRGPRFKTSGSPWACFVRQPDRNSQV